MSQISSCDINSIYFDVNRTSKNHTVLLVIDECTRPNDFPCHGVCKDTNGSYECNCRAGYESDGDPKEKPCRPKLFSSAKRIIGIHTSLNML
jgi:hypothetical protein